MQCIYTKLKIIEAQQAKIHNIYKSIMLKLLKTNAAIWFNKMCRTKQLKSKYIGIKVSGNNTESKRTTTATTKGRL